MKITVPAITFQNVGWRSIQPTRSYFYAIERPDVVPPRHYETIREPRLTTHVVFDRDLRIADRAAAVGKIAAMSAYLSVAIPVAAIAVGVDLIGRGLSKARDFACDVLFDIDVDFSWSFATEYRRLFREVVR